MRVSVCLQRYVPSLERIVVLRMLAQLSSVYHTVTLEKLKVRESFWERASYSISRGVWYMKLSLQGIEEMCPEHETQKSVLHSNCYSKLEVLCVLK